MIKIEKRKLIIEIENSCPEDYLHELTKAIPNAVISMDDDLYCSNTVYTLLSFLLEINPSFEQLKKGLHDNESTTQSNSHAS